MQVTKPSKRKGLEELKGLDFWRNFKSNRTRSTGLHYYQRSMKINIVSWNVRGLNRHRKRMLIRSLIHRWKADVFCFQDSKLKGDIREFIRELWANRWFKYAQLEASGPRGGIIVLWDSKIGEGEISSLSSYSVTCKFIGKTQEYTWNLSTVYAPNDREERKEVWWELAGARGIFMDLG